jgi:two-component system cell cycle response regulator
MRLVRLAGRYDCTFLLVTRKKAPSDGPPGRPPGRHGASHAASLIVVYGTEIGRRLPLEQHNFTIGRSTRCDLFIDQEAVSRKHAQIVYAAGRYTIMDERSSNGVRVNDERITEHLLSDGDKIQIGQTVLTFLSGIEKRYQDVIYRLMTVDGPTGAYNRRYFGDALERECARALRDEAPLSIVLFEIDGFASTVAQHGSLAGETVLRTILPVVRAKLRQKDILGRLGSAEFAVLCPEVDLGGARKIAEKLRAIVEVTAVSGNLAGPTYTLSLGTAALSKVEPKPAALFASARSALLDAKRKGGNRVGIPKESS